MGISKKKKECLCEFQNYTCEQCNKKFSISDLNIHRINRGGSYLDHRNLKVLCKDCHKLYHFKEGPRK